MIIGQWFRHIDCAPVRVIDYSTTIEPHWLFVIISTNSSNWLFTWVVKRVQSNNSHDWLFEWLIIQQRFDNDCLINQLAWLIFDNDWATLTICDYINEFIKLIIHLSSQASSIKQLAWLIIRVIDYSATIRQWLFNQPARVIDYSTMIKPHWLFVINQPTHHIDYSFK